MRTKENDDKFIAMLEALHKSFIDLTIFFEDTDIDGEYAQKLTNLYPFQYSFSEYLKGIKEWVEANKKALEYKGKGAVSRRFCFDDERAFNGYTFGDLWNGWECPHFEFETAMEVARFSNEGGGYMSSYDKETDTFYFYDPASDETETYTGEIIPTERGEKKVYALGAYCWCWLDANAKYS